MGIPARVKSLLRRVTPWATPDDCGWREARFCVVDIETTGLSAADEIISVGVVEVRNARITPHTFYEVARPTRPISPDSMRVHALTHQEVAQAPAFDEVLPRLKEVLEGSVIVAHAAWIERAFLNRALKPYGERMPERLVDTAALARRTGLAEPGPREPSLELLSRQLGLPVHTPHHALGDAQTTAQLLLALATRLEAEFRPLTVESLYDISAAHGR